MGAGVGKSVSEASMGIFSKGIGERLVSLSSPMAEPQRDSKGSEEGFRVCPGRVAHRHSQDFCTLQRRESSVFKVLV